MACFTFATPERYGPTTSKHDEMKNLFVITVFISLALFGRQGFTQNSSSDAKTESTQKVVLTELPDRVLNANIRLDA